MGPISPVDHLPPGSRFHLDFGFMRASSDSFHKTPGASRVVDSYDGYNSYLLITDAKTRFTWFFSLPARPHPLTLLKSSCSSKNGLPNGYPALHLDQGGEIWRSDALRNVTANAG